MNAEHPIVYVVDDDASIRDALRNLFRSIGLRVEAYDSAQAFLSGKRVDAPSCLVLDVRLPGLSGLDLQRQLREANIQVPIIFITAHGDVPMSVRAMKAGAVEFLTKPFRDQDLLDAVQEAIERDHATRRRHAETAQLSERYESLSIREREVLGLVVRGLPNKEIASELGIVDATVKLHRGKVMRKMQAASLAELIRMSQELGVRSSSMQS